MSTFFGYPTGAQMPQMSQMSQQYAQQPIAYPGATQYVAPGTAVYAQPQTYSAVPQPQTMQTATAYTIRQEPVMQEYYVTTQPTTIKTVYQAQMTTPHQTVKTIPSVYGNFVAAGQQPTPQATPQVSANTASTSAATTAKLASNQGYDQALINVANNYASERNKQISQGRGFTRKSFWSNQRRLGPPKPQQLHYCEICKISCAGPQTYKEHLEGQKHKKKEQSSKGGKTVGPPVRVGQSVLRCDLCDVTCTGSDAYAAHVRGAKHQKTTKLHQHMGKPIPKDLPTVVNPNGTELPKPVTSTASTTSTASSTPVHPAKAAPTTTTIPGFVGGTTLKQTATGQLAEVHEEPDNSSQNPNLFLPGEKDIAPVGQEYITESINETGKVTSYHCKLCDCNFNDHFAREMHLKGRRHRMSYKKKVDPNLEVDLKFNTYNRRYVPGSKGGRKEMYDFMRFQHMDRMIQQKQRQYQDPYFTPAPVRPAQATKQPYQNFDERHVLAKHSSIYPLEEELEAVQNTIALVERALKMVSDHIAEQDKLTAVKAEPKDPKDSKSVKEGSKPDGEMEENRQLKGVMRVGAVAKGLLLRGSLKLDLVVICADKPTKGLLKRILDVLPKKLNEDTDGVTYTMKLREGCIIVVSPDKADPKVECHVMLTCPTVRETTKEDDPSDMLSRDKCLAALSHLRHAKWFQAKLAPNSGAVIIVRVLKDLCARVPTWSPLTEWAVELVVEKCAVTAACPLQASQLLRRAFECIASGILLPGGPGISDPCERDPLDAAVCLSEQQREDITASAQHALRLIAFHQIYKVLGMERLAAPTKKGPIKRKAENEPEADEEKKEKVGA